MRYVFLAFLFLSTPAFAEDIRVGAYNIEFFARHFLGRSLTPSRSKFLPKDDAEAELILDALKSNDDKSNWETSEVILDPKFLPDVMGIEEGCKQEDLDYFCHHWLKDRYYGFCFPGNSDRNQSVCMIIKAGFNVKDRKDQYYLEKDPGKNDRGDRLFARGPAFVKIESPEHHTFWVGVNHQKSKSGNSVEVTQWRNRESARTHAILKELETAGPTDVIFLGDMNDELGIQEFEAEAGGDTITTLVGKPEDGITLLTKALADSGAISYGGYWKTDHRSLIDHAFATASMARRVGGVEVFHDGFTDVASDHFPILVKLNFDAKQD